MERAQGAAGSSVPQIGTPGEAYAVAYPFGVVGILLTMGLVRMFFRINVEESAHSWAVGQNGGNEPVESMNIDVRNATGAKIFRDLEHAHAHSVVVSRVLHTGAQHMARDDEEIAVGDTILVDGPHSKLEELRNMLGAEAEIKLQDDLQGPIQTQRFVVTRSQMLGQHIFQSAQVGVAITRVNRGGVELSPSAAVRLQFGDQLTCVGEEAGLSDFAKLLGNDAKGLAAHPDDPDFPWHFLGVLVGSLPIFGARPAGADQARIGRRPGHRRDPSVAARAPWTSPVRHMPVATINVVREIGISLFMCCVGIYAGKSFVNTVLHGDGLKWMLCATMITFIPLIVAGELAHGPCSSSTTPPSAACSPAA